MLEVDPSDCQRGIETLSGYKLRSVKLVTDINLFFPFSQTSQYAEETVHASLGKFSQPVASYVPLFPNLEFEETFEC